MYSIKDKKVIGRECRFVTHVPSGPKNKDAHLIKEIIHYEDGTKIPNLKFVTNFKRPFFVTKKNFQNHEQKKESESISKLNKYEATQSELANEVAKALGMEGYRKNQMRDVSDDPFVYGTDISSTTLIKQMYQKQFPDFNTPFTYCVLDIEADTETQKISMISIATKDHIFSCIVKDVFNENNPKPKLEQMFDKYIPDTSIKYIDKVKTEVPTLKKTIKRTIELVNSPMEAIEVLFKELHRWKPDWLSIWNMDYDIPVIMKECELSNIDPADIFSDPMLPKSYRRFKYKRGRTKHVTESGKEMPIDPQARWHTVTTPASFYVIDAMCSYNFVRIGAAKIPGGYGLDNILSKELDLFKLKFPDIPTHLIPKEWHEYMVKHRPHEYFVYHQWDLISMLELENKNGDLVTTLPVLSGPSDFKDFASGPKKILDLLHFFLLERNEVPGNRPKTLNQDKILGLDGWIN